MEASYLQSNTGDDREGIIDHPDLGQMSTYLFEETHNVHYFYDVNSGNWVRMPVAWEMKSDLTQKLMEPIQVCIKSIGMITQNIDLGCIHLEDACNE